MCLVLPLHSKVLPEMVKDDKTIVTNLKVQEDEKAGK
jgi:hypothetical protein